MQDQLAIFLFILFCLYTGFYDNYGDYIEETTSININCNFDATDDTGKYMI